jgi:hypothetical protein
MGLTTQPVTIIRSIGGFTFDAVFKEDHTHEAEITDEPLETGVSCSDHAYMKPYRITISGGVGDVSIHPDQNDPFAGSSRAQNAFNLLTQLQESFQPFSVQTGLILYENMLIKMIKASQDKDTAGSLVFEAELKFANIISTETITYPPRAAGSTTHQASSQTNKGQQQGSQVTDPKKVQTIALQVLKFFSGGSQ